MKTTKKCGCDGQDVIVITIECCNKKTCGHLKKKRARKGGVDDGTDSGDGGDAGSDTGGGGGAISPSPSKSKVDSSSDEDDDDGNKAKGLKPHKKIEGVIDPGDNKGHKGHKGHKGSKHHKDDKEDKGDGDSTQIFTLPVLPERYHGAGCAMEVAIMEKHDNNCLYKKTANDKRNSSEDRVGSYECVGRLIFRTCDHPNDALALGTSIDPSATSNNNNKRSSVSNRGSVIVPRGSITSGPKGSMSGPRGSVTSGPKGSMSGPRGSVASGSKGSTTNQKVNETAVQRASILSGPRSSMIGPSLVINNTNTNTRSTVNEGLLNFLVQPHMQRYSTFNKENIRKQMEKLQNTLLDRSSIKALATVSKSFPVDEKPSVHRSMSTHGTSINVLAPKDSLDTIITLSSESDDDKLVQYGMPNVINKFFSLFKKRRKHRTKEKVQ